MACRFLLVHILAYGHLQDQAILWTRIYTTVYKTVKVNCKIVFIMINVSDGVAGVVVSPQKWIQNVIFIV